MNTLRLFLYGLSIILIGSTFSCREDKEVFTPDPDEEQGLTTIVGQIVDEDNIPISQVDVRSGVNITQTDENGIFRLEAVKTSGSKAYIRAIKDGYHHASRLHFSTDRVENYIKIMMLDLEPIGNFMASDGGLIVAPGDVRMTFQPASIVTSSGADYSGEVTVQAAYLDPNDDDFSDKMPGNLLGRDRANLEQGLISYGMFAVELVGSSGQSLNIKDGLPTSVNAPIPDGIRPDNLRIPLWSFDETEGTWVEESFATVDVDRMVGEVPHFSWWNFDVPTPMVLVCMELIIDASQQIVANPASNVCGCIVREAGAEGKQKVCGNTDENGQFKARVPVDEEMTLEVKDPCGSIIYTTTIGPYTEDTEEPAITIPSSTVRQMIVSGTLVSCDGSRVNNGYVVYSFGDDARSIINYVDDGIVSDTLIICDAESFTVSGVDVDNITQTTVSTFDTDGAVNIGEIIACEDIVEFVKINYTINGENKSKLETLVTQVISDSDNLNYIQNEGVQSDTIEYALTLAFDAFTTGTFTEGSFSLYEFIERMSTTITCDTLDEIIITSYNVVGDYIEGSFTASACLVNENGNSENSDVTGTFRVIREE